ncbi:MAG: hypothetical protein U5K69_26660 [Balneolaceae bacterium]|nr:hypothetical protein [Balneolaceae bacterium]
MYEPYIKATILTPSDYIGPVMKLCQNKRGIYVNQLHMQGASCRDYL